MPYDGLDSQIFLHVGIFDYYHWYNILQRVSCDMYLSYNVKRYPSLLCDRPHQWVVTGILDGTWAFMLVALKETYIQVIGKGNNDLVFTKWETAETKCAANWLRDYFDATPIHPGTGCSMSLLVPRLHKSQAKHAVPPVTTEKKVWYAQCEHCGYISSALEYITNLIFCVEHYF